MSFVSNQRFSPALHLDAQRSSLGSIQRLHLATMIRDVENGDMFLWSNGIRFHHPRFL